MPTHLSMTNRQTDTKTERRTDRQRMAKCFLCVSPLMQMTRWCQHPLLQCKMSYIFQLQLKHGLETNACHLTLPILNVKQLSINFHQFVTQQLVLWQFYEIWIRHLSNMHWNFTADKCMQSGSSISENDIVETVPAVLQ